MGVTASNDFHQGTIEKPPILCRTIFEGMCCIELSLTQEINHGNLPSNRGIFIH